MGSWKGSAELAPGRVSGSSGARQGPHIRVDGVSRGILNFCANNYLGLSSHPEVIQAGLKALWSWP